jgi:dolichol-phosphate mannosyltransferase
MPLVLVTLCTYNERENLGALVPEIRRTLPDADVMVIDDGSPDGTGALADELSASEPRVRVLHRAGKLGLGSAILAGMRRAIADGYDFVINMDADFSHDPRHLPALVACMERADVAIGSRYVPGGGIEGWGPLRHFMSRGINWYARLLLGLSTRDNSGAYRCYRCSKLAQINLDRVRARGYAFQEEILFHCRLAGCRFAETPIVFHDRRYGTSKINWRESAAALWIILRLGAGNACGLFSKSGNSQREANSDVVE